jgi:hypothetical protein
MNEPLIWLVVVADETYAVPAALCLRSAFSHAGDTETVSAHLVDCGLSRHTREALPKDRNSTRHTLAITSVDASRWASPVRSRLHRPINSSTYAGLALDQLVPADTTECSAGKRMDSILPTCSPMRMFSWAIWANGVDRSVASRVWANEWHASSRSPGRRSTRYARAGS